MSWDCKCDLKPEPEDECSCNCAVPKKTGFYNPDTPTIEIDRRIEEAREKAYECQRIWQKVKNSPAPGFDEPPPLQFPGTCPPPPEPVIVPEPDDKDTAWCRRLSQIVTPIAVPLLQNNGCANEVPAVPISCPCAPVASDCEPIRNNCPPSIPSNSCTVPETDKNECLESEKPNASECQKFLKYAKGMSMNDNSLELYDPRNKDYVRDNIKSCMYLGTACFEGFDETVASMANQKKACNCNCQVEKEPCDIDRVKEVPKGCCDYRKATGKSDRFYLSEDYDYPPMPASEVERLVMPPWFECPSGSSVAPLPAPVGAKIKPISKGGIRTNFERNPNCLCCGAKRKDPFKQKCMKDVNQNCPAMKTRCSSSSKSKVEKKDNSYFQQIKNMIGIKW